MLPISCNGVMNSPSNLYWIPDLLNEVLLFENEYGSEWKNYLSRANDEEIKNSNERFIFYSPKIVRSVFNICSILKQPPEVRYLAVDILDRFLVQHFFDVAEAFKRVENHSMFNWKTVIERMLDQSLLRVLTCVQLAIKYSCSNNVITAETIQEVMKYFGHTYHYSKKSIVKSEARVYQSLNYNIPSKTPLTYVEMFFEDFQQRGFFSMWISLREFFAICIYVLDFTLIHHQDVYSILQENNSIVPSKADLVVLAASVIYASVLFKYPSAHISHVLLHALCSAAEREKSDIQMLGQQVFKIMLKE